MTDQEFMLAAIDQAKKSSEKIRCGVVIVKDDHIIAEAFNSHHADNDATAHAEIKAIRQAGELLGTKNLHGCTAYTTCEPCTMCAGALLYTEVDKIFYGVTMESIDPNNTRIRVTLEELISKKTDTPIVVSGFMELECKQELYS